MKMTGLSRHRGAMSCLAPSGDRRTGGADVTRSWSSSRRDRGPRHGHGETRITPGRPYSAEAVTESLQVLATATGSAQDQRDASFATARDAPGASSQARQGRVDHDLGSGRRLQLYPGSRLEDGIQERAAWR